MRRWNGWGEETTVYPLPESAGRYLSARLPPGSTAADATLQQTLAGVPPSALPDDPLLVRDPAERLRHARGQSLPDWVALRSGRIGTVPDAVAFPSSEAEVRALLELAHRSGARVVPYGGGTSVVGHINPPPGAAPVITLDMGRLNRLSNLDETSRLATFEAGVRGPDLERQLSARGYTLGHFPQSFECSSLGGWIATRSCGQQSHGYGRIEALFAGGRLETPLGPLDLPPLPASAAGPDLRQLVLGSEGRLGVITRATVRVRPLPEFEAFYGVFFRDWESGAAAVRHVAQQGVPLSMLRLSDAQETETTLALAGRERLTAWAGRGLSALGFGSGRCLLIVGVTGERQAAEAALARAAAIFRRHRALAPIGTIGSLWRKSRFLTPYLRNTLWERGYALDTFETALPWLAVLPAAAAIQAGLRQALAEVGSACLVFAHLSHAYADGASVYVTLLFPRSSDPDETLARWRAAKAAASREIVAHGGTISHQHGVGVDHAVYLQAEKGRIGMALMEAARASVDPNHMLNPGKLLGDS